MDEEDEFLYGPSDDKKESEVSKQEESNDDSVNILNTEKDNTSGEESSDSKNDKKQESSSEKEELDSDLEKEREHETDMLEDSSDSDVEFVIGPLASTSTNTETPGVVSKEGEENTEAGKDTNGSNASTNIHTVPVLKETHGLDINEVGKYDGVPVTELTLDELKDKPWRQPGADLSDYFNYGFDEISWLTYCKKQNTLRKDFNPAKVMAEIMSSGAMAGIMPGPISGPNGNNSGGPPPFMMGPMGMPPFMNGMPSGMPSGMQMPGMYGQNGGNGNDNGNTNANNDRINSSAMNNNSNSNSMVNQNNSGRSSLPHLPRLPSRPPASSNSPEPSMGRQQGGMNSSNYRERSDRALDMRSGRKSGQNYRDRSGRRH